MTVVPRAPKALKFKALPGLSEKQLSEHHDTLYAGYVKKLTEIEQKLETADRSLANATSSDFRALKKEETFATGGVYLHELYFENLGGPGGEPTGTLRQLIEEDFGSFQKWLEDFKACGLAARGWVILAYSWNDEKLHNYLSDIHSDGVWGCKPLLVLDVYEHAYFLDYATGRKAYIESFFKNVDWAIVNGRVEKSGLLKQRQKS